MSEVLILLRREQLLRAGDLYDGLFPSGHLNPTREDLIAVPLSWIGRTPDTCHSRLKFHGNFYRPLVEPENSQTINLALQVNRLKDLLHRDQTGLARGLAQIREHLKGCAWIAEGRGSYDWDDDRYRQESHDAFAEIERIAKTALEKSGAEAHAVCCRSALEEIAQLHREMDWLDQHTSYVADHPYVLGPFKRGELRKLAQAGLRADATGEGKLPV